MYNIGNNFAGEQADGSLVFPSGEIMTSKEREEIIKNSLNVPIRAKESDIKEVIKSDYACIIIGETGSGKTTELAQMIHEIYPNDIVITNIPLVSATLGAALYVSNIMYAKTGNPAYILGNGLVGYRTGKGTSEEKRTQIGFHTYGLDYLNVSLGNFERLLNSSNRKIHVVLDEIHEKGEDFIFYFSRIIDLSLKYPNRIKIYGSSATISYNYLNLLEDKLKKVSKHIPVIKVEGRTYPIDVIEENGGDIIDNIVKLYKDQKSILVFQPGKSEINKIIIEVKKRLGDAISIYPFHSEISNEELLQNLQANDNQKIFVATNAARTGVTLDINAVIDGGRQKDEYYDDYGNPVLISENITLDAYHQNKGRAGRKEEGIAIYLGKTPIGNLKQESLASVEKKVDEKKILMELLNGTNILKDNSKYLFKPNKKMLELSYKWMKECGLITKKEQITKYGYESLKIPTFVYSARAILEACEHGVADEVSKIVAIIENNGFLKKEFDIKKLPQSIFETSYSDFGVYLKLYEILTSYKIDDKLLNSFLNMGVDKNLINYFKSLNGREKFYKVIGKELEKIGIKYKSLENTDKMVFKINTYLNSYKEYNKNKNKDFDANRKKELISYSLLSGNLHRIYIANGKNKNGKNTFNDFYGISDIEFEQSNTSYVDIKQGSFYIGSPFIIGGDKNKEDLAILSFLTEVKIGDIEILKNRRYTAYKPNLDKENIKNFDISDMKEDVFEVPKNILLKENKQKYLALNWLPYFLLDKNNIVKEFFKSGNFEKDNFIKVLQKITIKLYSKINPDDKEETINKFIDDKNIIKYIINSQDKEIRSFLNGDIETIKEQKIEIEKSNFAKLVEIKNKYDKKIMEIKDFIKKTHINTGAIKNKLLDKFINKLEKSSEDYANIIIFIKNINKKNSGEKKKEIKEEFIKFEKQIEYLKMLQKSISWLEKFIDGLEKIINGENVGLKELKYGLITDQKILLESKIIRENNLLNIGNNLNKKLKRIKKYLEDTGLSHKKKNLIIDSYQRILFFDKKKFNGGKKKIKNNLNKIEIEKNILIAKIDLNIKLIKEKKEDIHFKNIKIGNLQKDKKELKSKIKKTNGGKLIELNNELKNIDKEIAKLYKEIEKDQKLIKKLTEENKKLNDNILNLETLLNELKDFYNEILNLREIVKLLKLDNMVLSKYEFGPIYSEKFLYNTLIDIIFEGKFIFEKEDNSKIKSMFKNLELIDGIDIDELDLIMKFIYYKNSSCNEKLNNEKNFILISEYIIKCKKLLEHNRKVLLDNQEKITTSFDYVNLIIKSLKNILSDFYTTKIYDDKRIIEFGKKIQNFSITTFDEKLKEFIINYGNKKDTNIKDILLELEKYDDLVEEIGIIEKNTYLNENIEKKQDYIYKIQELARKIENLDVKFNSIKNITEKLAKL